MRVEETCLVGRWISAGDVRLGVEKSKDVKGEEEGRPLFQITVGCSRQASRHHVDLWSW